jgi:hypothetical protein
MPIDVLHSNLFWSHISFSASFSAHKHHLSPAFNPGKSQFGFGVIKSFPFNEYSKTHLSQLHKQREFQSQLK